MNKNVFSATHQTFLPFVRIRKKETEFYGILNTTEMRRLYETKTFLFILISPVFEIFYIQSDFYPIKHKRRSRNVDEGGESCIA